MYKKLFFLLAVLLFTQLVFAQKEIGIKIGVTSNNIRANDFLEDYLEPAVFYSAGFSGNFWLQQHLFLSTGIHYERRGSRLKDITFTDGTGTNTVTGDAIEQLDYLTIPLSAHYSFGTKNQFALGAGMFGSYLLAAHYKIKADSDSISVPGRTDIKNLYEDLNYGFLFNASYRIPIQKNWILAISAEDHLGLKTIKEFIIDDQYKTHSFGLYASLLFLIK